MDNEKLEKIRSLLEEIRDFGHHPSCYSMAPIYECGCYEQSQSELAAEALKLFE